MFFIIEEIITNANTFFCFQGHNSWLMSLSTKEALHGFHAPCVSFSIATTSQSIMLPCLYRVTKKPWSFEPWDFCLCGQMILGAQPQNFHFPSSQRSAVAFASGSEDGHRCAWRSIEPFSSISKKNSGFQASWFLFVWSSNLGHSTLGFGS